jgi:hypothetical protein
MIAPSILKFRASLFAAFLAVAAMAPASYAQDAGVIAKVNVPFAFETASGQHFNAGVYTVRMETTGMTLIRGLSKSGFAPTMVEDDAQPAKSGKAKFRKYGNEYFLTEISMRGSSRRLTFRPSKAERHLQIAQNNPVPSSVEVALLESTR